MTDERPSAGANVPSEQVDYYAGDVFWGGFSVARAEINRRASGDPEVDWVARFRQLVGGRRFRRALVLNCGNGWVERRLVEAGIIDAAIGIDVSEELLDEARRQAAERSFDLTYRATDTNEADFADEDVDLVVNHAALHHVQRLDRVLRTCAAMLPDDGMLVSWDYVGPHRNQWPWDQYAAARALDRSLPERFRSDVGYPHLPTMLVHDPTEAVHSELVQEVVRRYFVLDEEAGIGGGLAYLVLAGKRELRDAPRAEQDPVVEAIMDADARWHAANPDRDLFWFVVGRPRRGLDPDDLQRWEAEEEAREAAAADGEYYPRTELQELTLELSDQRLASEHRLAWGREVQVERNEAIVARDQAILEREEVEARLEALLRSRPVRAYLWVRRAGTRLGGRLRRPRDRG